MTLLGELYNQGLGVPQDPAKAVDGIGWQRPEATPGRSRRWA